MASGGGGGGGADAGSVSQLAAAVPAPGRGGPVRTSPQQFQIMLQFMEEHGDLNRPSRGQLPLHERVMKWQRLCAALNAAGEPGGNTRIVSKWQKVWSDLKNNTKRKALKLANSPGESSVHLSQSEFRVLKIIGMIKTSKIPVPPPSATRATKPSPAPLPSNEVTVVAPKTDDNFVEMEFTGKLENPLEEADPPPDVEADRCLEEDMFAWPKPVSPRPSPWTPGAILRDCPVSCVLEGTVMEDNSVLVRHAAPEDAREPGAPTFLLEGGGGALSEEAPSPSPLRPDARGHTSAREARRGQGEGRGPGDALSRVARELGSRRRMRSRELRVQRRWQRICERGLSLMEKVLLQQRPSRGGSPPAPAPAPEGSPLPSRPLVLNPDRYSRSP